ncbi:uncharacterized protein MELLADRAFT_40240 [Melampsora larici-populina 98AG31]|uniref:RNA-binding S4 domain-containing protein n=1 Tax=Melampsora larici-populina (strain 98AG31 / pathotype 3-4-7) TaxID=747676 RepID=F4S771_MELLP|nr:uncharacterized protein MELLADRAFT_40240 [Melampsora larici-populina 98AG31]EGF99460.1 hypothetical protein MELLADRAFT_40240 [Melampsora larici-populina 98AG31]
MRKLKNPYNCKKTLPRMSWHPQNLFNLFQRTYGPESKETNFTRTSKTVYWQRCKSRAVTRAYHGDWIQEKKFKRHYLPASLPKLSIQPYQKINKSNPQESKVPLAAMMYTEVERRLDVVLFRSCFADSVYEARRMVLHNAVKLNGVRCIAPWTRLHPGDMITVHPASIPLLNPGKTWPAGLGEAYVVDIDTPKKPSEPSPITTSLHLPFRLPAYASPFLFIPPYLEVSFRVCSMVYLRHPTCGPGFSEIPTPWNADGEVMRLAWEWYTRQGLGRRVRKERKEWDEIRETKRDPFAEGHLRKNAIGGRVAVHGRYQGGRIGRARMGSGEPRMQSSI